MNNYIIYWAKLPEHICVHTQGYIGLTEFPDKRELEHRQEAARKNKTHFHKALNKYNDKIEFFIIHENLTKEQAISLEFLYRDEENIGWNQNKGGDVPPSRKGKKMKEEQVEKMKIIGKEVAKSNKGCFKKGNIPWNKGKKNEYKLKTTYKMPAEIKEKLRKINTGKKLTEEHKHKISKALKGRQTTIMTDETKEKISKANKGKKLTEEQIETRRKNAIQYWEDVRKGIKKRKTKFNKETRKYE